MSNTLLDPKNDFVFKKLFAESPDLLADLINAVRSGEDPVEIIEILNPRIDPEDLTGKFIILDVLARDTRGHLFNIEMQVRRLAEWIERSLYYIASAYVDQLKQGDNYITLKPVIGINLLDFDLFDSDQAHWHFRLVDRTQPDVTLEPLQLHVLELRKLDRQREASPGVLGDWIAWFKHWREDNVMSEIHHPPVQKAQNQLKRLSDDEETRWRALARERALHDEASFLASARREGLEEGIQIGEGRGRTVVLSRQLTLKFGELSVAVQQRLRQASEAELDAWAERILFAESLDEVFR